MTQRIAITGDEVGDFSAPIGTPLWVQAFRLKLKAELDTVDHEVGRVRSDLELLRDKEWFRQLRGPTGQSFTDFAAFCEAPWPFGLGMQARVREAILSGNSDRDTIGQLILNLEADQARELASPAERGRRGGRGKKATGETPELLKGTKQHILSELKTYAPDILERYRYGDFKSAASARREAVRQGLLQPRKPVTSLQVLQRAWKKASLDERAAFLDWIAQ
jgi:hypothetical protein